METIWKLYGIYGIPMYPFYIKSPMWQLLHRLPQFNSLDSDGTRILGPPTLERDQTCDDLSVKTL